MVRRDPIETGGKYYRILPEGLLKDYDGVTIKVIGPKQGLDLNRNFPAGWHPESDQQGAGPVSRPPSQRRTTWWISLPGTRILQARSHSTR